MNSITAHAFQDELEKIAAWYNPLKWFKKAPTKAKTPTRSIGISPGGTVFSSGPWDDPVGRDMAVKEVLRQSRLARARKLSGSNM